MKDIYIYEVFLMGQDWRCFISLWSILYWAKSITLLELTIEEMVNMV